MDLVRLTDWLLITGVALALALALLRGYVPATHPLLWFLVGTCIFLHVGSIRDHFGGVTYIRHRELMFRALEAAHIACIALGYWLGIRRRRSTIPEHPRQLLAGRFLLVIVVSLAAKLYFSNPFVAFDPDTSNYTKFLGHLAVPAACLALAFYESRRLRLAGSLRLWAPVLTFTVVIVWTFGASRTPVMYGLTCLFGYVLWRNRQRTVTARWLRRAVVVSLPAISVGLVALGSFVKGISSVYRRGREVDIATQAAIEHGRHLQFIDAYENGLFAFHAYPAAIDFRWAESYLAVLLGPVPRSYWSAKPYGFSFHLTAEKLGPEARDAGLSLATSLLGDMWACGGVVSVVAASALFGLWMGRMQAWRIQHLDSAAHQVIYWLFLFLCMLSARGDIYTVFQRGGSYLFLTWLLYRLCSVRPRSYSSRRRPHFTTSASTTNRTAAAVLHVQPQRPSAS